jgi:hypothetical protein
MLERIQGNNKPYTLDLSRSICSRYRVDSNKQAKLELINTILLGTLGEPAV